METKAMGILYQEIAEKIQEIIPDTWSKVYLYAEVLKDSSMVYFYFYNSVGKLVYSENISENYNVSEEIYDKLLFELFDLFEKLHKEYKDNNQEVWTNLTLILEETGKIQIEFDYENVLELSTTERQIIWEYKNLGLIPEDQDYKIFLENYLKSVE